jgi:hypothetical protein
VRRTVVQLMLILILPVSVLGIEIDAFQYRDPSALALGGTTVFGSGGIHVLHANPAEISLSDDVNYTLLAATPWLTLSPSLYGGIAKLSESDLIDAGRSGFGAGINAITGLSGKGVGLGLLLGSETAAAGDGSSLSGFVDAELALVVGYAADIDLGGVTLVAGGDIRPVLRIFGPYSQAAALDAGAALSSPSELIKVMNAVENPYYGAGIGFDLGTTLHWRGLSVGALVRDVGDTVLSGSRPEDVETAFGEMFSLAAASLEDENPESITIPMNVTAGLRYAPEEPFFGLLQPAVYIELKDLFGSEAGALFPDRGLLGLDLGFPGPLSVRSGINGGGFNLGLGLDLPIFAVEAAYYRLPKATGAGNASYGFTLEGRIEF